MPDKLEHGVMTAQLCRRTWQHKRERRLVWKQVIAAANIPNFPVAYMPEFMRCEMKCWALRYARARDWQNEHDKRQQLSFVTELENANPRRKVKREVREIEEDDPVFRLL